MGETKQLCNLETLRLPSPLFLWLAASHPAVEFWLPASLKDVSVYMVKKTSNKKLSSAFSRILADRELALSLTPIRLEAIHHQWHGSSAQRGVLTRRVSCVVQMYQWSGAGQPGKGATMSTFRFTLSSSGKNAHSLAIRNSSDFAHFGSGALTPLSHL